MYLIWQTLNIEKQTIKVVPWARGYRRLQVDHHAVLFPISRSDERDKLFKWVGPILSEHYVIVAKKTIAPERLTKDNLFNNSFALIRDDITEEMLKKQQVTNLVESTDIAYAENMLANNRIDMLAISMSGLSDIYKAQPNKRKQYKVVGTLGITYDYIAFNKHVPDSVIKRYQTAVDQLQDKLELLRQKYGLAINESQLTDRQLTN